MQLSTCQVLSELLFHMLLLSWGIFSRVRLLTLRSVRLTADNDKRRDSTSLAVSIAIRSVYTGIFIHQLIQIRVLTHWIVTSLSTEESLSLSVWLHTSWLTLGSWVYFRNISLLQLARCCANQLYYNKWLAKCLPYWLSTFFTISVSL